MLLIATLLVCSTKADINIDNKKQAVQILKHYSASKYISADIEKTDEKVTLGTKSINKGVIKYSSGKFFLQLQADKKTELYFKNGKLTLVDYPDQDFDKDGVRKITHITQKTPAFLKSLINLFSNSKDFFKQFKLTDSTHVGDEITLRLKPTTENLKDFELKLNVKSKTIESILFSDELSTVTSIKFSNADFKSIIPKAIFEFKVLKTDQEVTQ